MLSAKVSLDPVFRIAPVRRRTFGSFVEHMGRSVYTGIFEPEHPSADEDGFRTDVLDLVRELGVSTVRYPGGNFVSGYRWEDGVGPVEERPSRLDLAWHTTEPNTVGLNEFMRWAGKAGVEPMMAVNLGTRGIQEAVDLLEYCNLPEGTEYADLRRAHGVDKPHDVRMWCLGNELDGPWQVGHKTPEEYGRLATETARAMRMVDPDLELVACGSSNSSMPAFGAWEATVLDAAYEHVDYISAHAYYWERDGDTASFLASAVDMDHFIESVTAAADYVRASKKMTKRVNISFDEWNVWYQRGPASRPPRDSWPVAPRLLEDVYTLTDAVVVGGLLISLLRHSDRVHAASQAQLVNVIAPIMTAPGGKAWRQTTFYPFAQASRHARGQVLRTEIDAPTHTTERFGDVPVVDAVATHDEESGEIAVFAVNRSTTETVRVELDLRGGAEEPRLLDAQTLTSDDPRTQNTEQDPEAVLPRPNPRASVENGKLYVELPPVSWNVVRTA
ncbi:MULTISPECIES: alpha-N-arabinofuranosidase [unclassified Streptomyces]|uniref:arabinosylfuranosidase ArfA n=1 Tax=unclassified Streptomyces TaxID=2593676 RepID=UPI00278BC5FB|nr:MULTISPECIES: alpha-N-arabinofuranosidase [unclassified Streptomyces]